MQIIGLEKMKGDYIFTDTVEIPIDQKKALEAEVETLRKFKDESKRNYLKGRVIDKETSLPAVIAMKLRLPNSHKILAAQAKKEEEDGLAECVYKEYIATKMKEFNPVLKKAWIEENMKKDKVERPADGKKKQGKMYENFVKTEKIRYGMMYDEYVKTDEGKEPLHKKFEDSPFQSRYVAELYFFLTNIAFISYGVYELLTADDSEWDPDDHLTVSKYLSRFFEGTHIYLSYCVLN